MAERITWEELREELGVDASHPAYDAARIAFEVGEEVRVQGDPATSPPR